MPTYPRSCKELTRGMMYFPRMLDKIRLHADGELHEDYHKNLGAVKAADGVCCNFLRVHYRDLRERVRSEEHTSELQSQSNLVCRLLLEQKASSRLQRCSRRSPLPPPLGTRALPPTRY